MEFIKNIKGNFNLDPSYNLLKKVHNLSIKDYTQPILKVRIVDIDMDGATFMVSDPKALSTCTKQISQSLIEKLSKECSQYKKAILKVIKEWENSPEKFIPEYREYSSENVAVAYKHVRLLTDEEYNMWPAVYFDKISIAFGNFIGARYGAHTYKEKNYYVKASNELDTWLSKTIKEIQSSKFQNRIDKYLGKINFTLSYKEIIKLISVPTDKSESLEIHIKKEKFPLEFPAEILNSILSETGGDNVVIDSEFIKWIKDDYDFDISKLEDWELEAETKGYHTHDGQDCDYTVTFTSPNGNEYYIYNTHCLVTGWNFDGTLIPE